MRRGGLSSTIPHAADPAPQPGGLCLRILTASGGQSLSRQSQSAGRAENDVRTCPPSAGRSRDTVRILDKPHLIFHVFH